MNFFFERYRMVPLVTGWILLGLWLFSIKGGTQLRDRYGQPLGPDFLPFYSAGDLISEGLGMEIYRFGSLVEKQSEILKSPQEYLHYFPYPAPFAWGMQVFAWMDYRVAFAVWTLIGLMIYRAVWKWMIPDKSFWWGVGWYPVFAVLSYGQNTFWTLGIVAIGALLWQRDRYPWQAGMVLGLLCYKPQWIVGFLVGFMVLKEWRVVGGMALTGFLGLGLSLLFLRQETLCFFDFILRKMPQMIHLPGSSVIQCQDWKSAGGLLFKGISEGWSWMIYGIMVTFLAVCFRRWNLAQEEVSREAQIAGVLLIAILVAPYLLIYDYTLLILVWGFYRRAGILIGEKERVVVGLIWIAGMVSYPLALLLQKIQAPVIPLLLLVVSGIALKSFFRLEKRTI